MNVRNLINALFSEHGVVRESAARSLGNIGSKAKDAVPALIELLNDKDPAACFESEEALLKIGAKAVPSLIEVFKNKNICVRAADILGKIGIEAVPALIEALKSQDSDVCCNAEYALAGIAPQARSVAALALAELLKDGRCWIRVRAVCVLKTMNTLEALQELEDYEEV
jgi:HEAT repeat protein